MWALYFEHYGTRSCPFAMGLEEVSGVGMTERED